MSAGFEPTDVANQALDACGWATELADIEDGSREANLCLRAYGQCLRQLLRAAHWDFARRRAPLTLLADATGQTPNVGSLVADPQFIYEYSLPVDCLKVRYVPWVPNSNTPIPPNNYQTPNVPQTTAGFAVVPGMRPRPARFLLTRDSNYPPPVGSFNAGVQGVSEQGRTVILTNVPRAYCVYTSFVAPLTEWDVLFRSAFVSYLAQEIVLALWATKDRKFGLGVRTQQIAITRGKLQEARAIDGNEGWSSSDIRVDWMQTRMVGGYGGSAGAGFYDRGPGTLWAGWDACVFSDGSAY